MKSKENRDMDTNYFRVMWRGRKAIFNSGSQSVIIGSILILLIIYFFDNNSDLIRINDSSITNFLGIGVSSLSLILSAFSASLGILSVNAYSQISQFKSEKFEKNELFYISLVPYYIAPTLWMIISVISLLSLTVNISFVMDNIKIFNLIYVELVFLAVISLFSLIIKHLSDFIEMINRENDESE